MSKLQELDSTYIANTYARFPVDIASGKGSLLYDTDGKEYIDLGTGIAVNTFGASDDEWVAAVTAQLGKIAHTSNLYYTEPGVMLAKALCGKTGMKKVFFGNSGAEANECAIKAARKYAAEKKGEDYYTIISLVNSFHGRTLTTLAATGQEVFHTLFKPLTPGFVQTPANDIDALKKTVSEHKTAGIMIECVQGEGGVIPLGKEFVQAVADICAEEDIVFIVDEVQTGNGRTGELYSYMNFGVQPDVVTTAKGLAGGLPLGVCMMGEKVENVLGAGDHGSTFGMNPVCCAGALSILERIDDKLLSEVKEKSKYIFDAFEGAKGVESVTGLGLMIGIKPSAPAKEIVLKCMDEGVLCLTAKDKIRLLPALNIPMEELAKAVEIIKTVIAASV